MRQKFNLSITLKAIVIGVLVLIMLIPLTFVKNTVGNRNEYKNTAERKISNSWGSAIVIAAPVLNAPYRVSKSSGGFAIEYVKYAPQNLEADIVVNVDERYIGIFKFPVYIAEFVLRGNFEYIDSLPNINLKDAFITIETNELKGISVPDFVWNGKHYEFQPLPASLGSPLSVAYPMDYRYDDYVLDIGYEDKIRVSKNGEKLQSLYVPINFNGGSNNFEIKFSIKGSKILSFIPLAKTNTFRMSSNWQTPSFSGAFLPDSRTINKKGFVAEWNINSLASAIPNRIATSGDKNSQSDLSRSLFSTSFILPVDNYRNAIRASKYGILFIILTFVICFVFEIISQKPIHPIQYMLIGFAMTIFYILLVSMSEFMLFGFAYLIASFAVIALIASYAKFAIVKDMTFKQIFTSALSLTFLYGYLYILLQLEDYALLYGSIGLFVALAVIMFITRNIIWYEKE